VSAIALPTRKAESWRYSDVDALAPLWPLPAPEKIELAAGARGHRALLIGDDSAGAQVRELAITLAPGAAIRLHVLNLGSSLARVSLDVTLHEGADFVLDAALLGGTGQTSELITTVHHAQPGATSRQTVRAIAGSHATTSYLGTIKVAHGAQKTDAAQSFKAMLLDRTATANARPELEIFADDVKCAHGATVGELDKAAMFYCAARGLSPAQARSLLLQGFIAGLFEDMIDDDERALFEAAALARLAELA
jgi:Fe-S cluster assembly protein SufD